MGIPFPLDVLRDPQVLNSDLLSTAHDQSRVQVISPDVSPVTLPWDEIDGMLQVVSADSNNNQKYSYTRGMMVTRSDEPKLPAGSVIVGAAWQAPGNAGRYPASASANISDIPQVIDAFAVALKKKTTALKKETGVSVEMWLRVPCRCGLFLTHCHRRRPL